MSSHSDALMNSNPMITQDGRIVRTDLTRTPLDGFGGFPIGDPFDTFEDAHNAAHLVWAVLDAAGMNPSLRCQGGFC